MVDDDSKPLRLLRRTVRQLADRMLQLETEVKRARDDSKESLDDTASLRGDVMARVYTLTVSVDAVKSEMSALSDIKVGIAAILEEQEERKKAAERRDKLLRNLDRYLKVFIGSSVSSGIAWAIWKYLIHASI